MNSNEIADVLKNILKNEKLSEKSRSDIHKLLYELSNEHEFFDHPDTTDLIYAANRIIDAAIQRKWVAYEGAWIVSGKQYVTDGHRIMKINFPLPLRKLPESTTPPSAASTSFENTDDYSDEIPCPSISGLKQTIQESLKNRGLKELNYIIYQLSEEVQINAEYLLEALIATGAKNCRIKPGVSCVLFESEKCAVIVLPVHSTNKFPVGTCYALYHETGGYSHG